MNKTRNLCLLSGLAIFLAIAMLVTQGIGMAKPSTPPPTPEQATAEKSEATEQAKTEDQMCGMCIKHMHQMAKVKEALEEAKKAAEEEKATQTLSAIDEALKALEAAHKEMHGEMRHHMGACCRCMKTCGGESRWEHGAKCPMCGKMMMGKEPTVINSVCPISGKKINPYDVSDNRIREFHGKKIGFCCPNCPSAWDKLSDEDKQAKLDAAMKASHEKAEAAETEKQEKGESQ